MPMSVALFDKMSWFSPTIDTFVTNLGLFMMPTTHRLTVVY